MKTFVMTTALALTATVSMAGEDTEFVVGDETYSGYLARADNQRGTVVILSTWN